MTTVRTLLTRFRRPAERGDQAERSDPALRLLRQYLSPDVAASLLEDPARAALGGQTVQVTVLFADLGGFTGFAEDHEPAQLVEMLNAYHAVAVPCVLDNGGTIVQFVGDAMLALFTARATQRSDRSDRSDHATRAVRAALSMRDAVGAIAAREPHWPRFRIGLNTGHALVGNIGCELVRGFNAMGDAVNVAARLQTVAEPGQVVIGAATREAVGAGLVASPLGDLTVKGRRQPVRAYVAESLAAAAVRKATTAHPWAATTTSHAQVFPRPLALAA